MLLCGTVAPLLPTSTPTSETSHAAASLRMKKGPPEEETEWTAPKSHGSTAGENTVAQHVL
jgi:hypothetical protein